MKTHIKIHEWMPTAPSLLMSLRPLSQSKKETLGWLVTQNKPNHLDSPSSCGYKPSSHSLHKRLVSNAAGRLRGGVTWGVYVWKLIYTRQPTAWVPHIANVTYDTTSYSRNILLILCDNDYPFCEKSEMQRCSVMEQIQPACRLN